MDSLHSRERGASVPVRVAAGWALIFVALGLAGWFGELVEAQWGIAGKLRYGIQALIMAGMVVPGILLLRLKLDRQSLASLGLTGLRRSIVAFLFGIGIVLLPFLVTLLFTFVAGWATISLNSSGSVLSSIAAAVLTAFFFEALPEELAFRGYIYRNLNSNYKRWVAALMTVGLFAFLPVVLVQIQHYVLGMDIRIGGNDRLTVSYVAAMAVFGAFTMYLRILTGNIWTSIGFHLAFLQTSRLVSPREDSLVRLSDITTDTPMQIVLIGMLLLIFVGLIVYPFIFKKPLGWRERDPETELP